MLKGILQPAKQYTCGESFCIWIAHLLVEGPSTCEDAFYMTPFTYDEPHMESPTTDREALDRWSLS